MKLLIVLIATILVVDAIHDAVLWSQFKKEYSRTYKSLLEEEARFSIFQSNLRQIEEHNVKYERGEETYFLKITPFADMTNEEFKAIYLNYDDTEITNTEIFKLGEHDYVPEAIDWREKGAVLPVKNQGSCGSCWAFGATGALEGQNAIKHNIKISLSEEELVDCSKENNGCHGGNTIKAFLYVKENGISTEKSYPYVASEGKTNACKPKQNSGIVVLGYTRVLSTEKDLKEAVGTVGPVFVGINGDDIQLYGGGIFNNASCSKALNHAVLAVGYGSTPKLDYWIIQNSWSEDWGEKGYMSIARNKDQQCGISLTNAYPNIA